MEFAKPKLFADAAYAAAANSAEGADIARIRIILADTQAVYRVGTQKILALEDDIRVILQVDKLAGLWVAIQRFPADVILLDSGMISGKVAAIPDLVRLAPQLKVIVQTTQDDEPTKVELYRRGVRGIVPRSVSPDLLVKCVRRIAAGEIWIDNQCINRLIEAYRQLGAAEPPTLTQHLTPRELAVVSCIKVGLRNKEIGYRLGTTEQVIKNYLRKVYKKLGVSDRLELALYCLQHQRQEEVTGTVGAASIAFPERSRSIAESSSGRKAISPPHSFTVVR